MNERIRELAEQAGFKLIRENCYDIASTMSVQEFAELIVRECANLCKVVGADKVSNGSEDYNAVRALGAAACHNMIKKHFGVEE